jgi:hypothetical protein
MARNNRRWWIAIAFGAVLSTIVTSVRSQQDEKPFDRTPKECVARTAIHHMHAVNDRTVLFHMRGKKTYLNYLPRVCTDLARYDRIQYDLHGASLYLAQVCERDAFVVLDGDLDSTRNSCRFGQFLPVTDEEVALLLRKPQDGVADVVVTPVELPPAEESADEASAKPGDRADTEIEPESVGAKQVPAVPQGT